MHTTLGDSLARGLARRAAREESLRADRLVNQISKVIDVGKQTNGAMYRRCVAYVRRVLGEGLVEIIETGDGKQRKTVAVGAVPAETGSMSFEQWVVPFRSPTAIDLRLLEFLISRHAVQRITQVCGNADLKTWAKIAFRHSATLTPQIERDTSKDEYRTVLRDGITIWRPVTVDDLQMWTMVTYLPAAALDGSYAEQYAREVGS